jgi:hypothetical protein
MNNQSTIGILKLIVSIFFITFLFVLFGTSISTILSLITGTVSYITSGDLFVLLDNAISTFGFFMDTIFLATFDSYTYTFNNAITVYNLNFVLSFFRLLFGCTGIVLLFSLVFGNKKG